MKSELSSVERPAAEDMPATSQIGNLAPGPGLVATDTSAFPLVPSQPSDPMLAFPIIDTGSPAAGAEVLLLATNTMHMIEGQITEGLGIAFLHIADPTAEAIKAARLRSPSLLATAFTMERAFYADRLKAAGLHTVIPDVADRQHVHGLHLQ